MVEKASAHLAPSCFCKGVSNRGIYQADTFHIDYVFTYTKLILNSWIICRSVTQRAF